MDPTGIWSGSSQWHQHRQQAKRPKRKESSSVEDSRRGEERQSCTALAQHPADALVCRKCSAVPAILTRLTTSSAHNSACLHHCQSVPFTIGRLRFSGGLPVLGLGAAIEQEGWHRIVTLRVFVQLRRVCVRLCLSGIWEQLLFVRRHFRCWNCWNLLDLIIS